MSRKTILQFASLTAMLLLLATYLIPRSARADGPRTIDIQAKRFAFSPDQIVLKKGETVRLRLTSSDVTHGFFLRPLKIDEDIEPGATKEIVVTPQQAGTFTTICDHFCGANHGSMKMTIVVEE
jgi:cytochrome c oxidase subunit 2